MTAADVARAIGGRRSGSFYMACCPAHDDRNPSLAIRDGDDGRVLVRCHAGCAQHDVIAALRERGVWPDNDAQTRSEIVAAYDYTDAAGKLLYQVIRFVPKGFAQRRPNGAGWTWRKHPEQVLYRLREVLEAPIVFVAEGEKDVETLREYGFVATTNAGGANAPWLPAYTEALRGREVILIPDADPPGRARVARFASALLGNVARLVILELDGAKDVTDWFRAGHSELELIHLLDGEVVTG